MKKYFGLLCLGISILLCGCNTCFQSREMIVGNAQGIVIDGILNEKCWQNVPEYPLSTSVNAWKQKHPEYAKIYSKKNVVPGKVKFLCDKDYLYISANLTDDDIVALEPKNQVSHCTKGDVFEIFLKPENALHYWEIHITPAGYSAVIFYPSRGYHFLGKIVMPEKSPLKKMKYKVSLNGTLNNNKDKDRSWSVEAAIPLDELKAQGIPFDAKNQWRVLISRYNYSRYQAFCELSSCPELTKLDFHVHEEYGYLKLK